MNPSKVNRRRDGALVMLGVSNLKWKIIPSFPVAAYNKPCMYVWFSISVLLGEPALTGDVTCLLLDMGKSSSSEPAVVGSLHALSGT